MDLNEKIYIAGHRGLVGSAIVRQLELRGFTNLLMRTHKELDLINQAQVKSFFKQEKPDYVILAAAKVGGIKANNTYPADFIYQNMMIEANVINSAYENKVKRLLFLGSTCIYPRDCPQPITEASLLSGPLEPTNEAYALAKIAGLKLCQYYRRQHGLTYHSAMPTNLYGINDNYHPENSHVLPALIRKFHEAKVSNTDAVMIWGDGSPEREFLYADDLAEALVYLLKNYNEKQFVNVGYGSDISIKDLAHSIKEVIGYTGKMNFDSSKPNGTPKKQLDVSKINKLGWKASISLEDGIQSVCSILDDEFLAEIQRMPHRNLAVELLEKLLNGFKLVLGFFMEKVFIYTPIFELILQHLQFFTPKNML